MPAFTDLFGTVIPAQFNAPAQATLAAENGSKKFPAVVTLRFDENVGHLVADYLGLHDGGDDPTECAGVLSDAFNNNGCIEIQFDQANSASNLTASVLNHNLFAAAMGDHARGTLLVSQNEIRTGSSRLQTARFCIPDFPLFTGPGASTTVETTYSHAPDRRSWYRMGYVKMEAGDWQITIAQRTEPSPLEYSHDVYVSKKNRAQFTVEECNELVDSQSRDVRYSDSRRAVVAL